jgi:transketolase
MPELNQTSRRFEHVVGKMRDDKDEIEGTLVATGGDVEEAKELETNLKDTARKLVVVIQTLSDVPAQKAVLKELAQSILVRRKDAVVTATAKIPAEKMRQLFPLPVKKK